MRGEISADTVSKIKWSLKLAKVRVISTFQRSERFGFRLMADQPVASFGFPATIGARIKIMGVRKNQTPNVWLR